MISEQYLYWAFNDLIETLEGLEIQYSHALPKPERETNSHNSRIVFSRFFITAIRCIET